jgi:hypothetical protein
MAYSAAANEPLFHEQAFTKTASDAFVVGAEGAALHVQRVATGRGRPSPPASLKSFDANAWAESNKTLGPRGGFVVRDHPAAEAWLDANDPQRSAKTQESNIARMSGSSWNFDGGPLGLTVRR